MRSLAARGRRYASRTDEQLLEDARRAHAEAAPEPRFPAPGAVVRRDEGLTAGAGFPVFAATPAAAAADGPRVLYLHGGAYTNDFARWHWRLIGRLAADAGATVYAPQYPLAPERTWRDSFPQLVAMAEALDVQVLSGDSAGGGYALAIAQALAARGASPTVALLSPWADLTLSLAETEPYASRERWLTMNRLRVAAAAWAGGDELARRELSPLFGDFAGIRRMLVVAGTGERLYSEAAAVVDRAGAAGVPAELLVGELMPHVYPLLPIPEARPALAALVRVVRSAGR